MTSLSRTASRVAAAPFSERLEAEIRQSYTAMRAAGADPSSAVGLSATVEDLPETSCAGQ